MSHSQDLLAQAKTLIPGGVNSPVRAFNAVEGDPPFIRAASGHTLVDEDGQEYIDLVGSWGPMILGHGNAAVRAAIAAQLKSGQTFAMNFGLDFFYIGAGALLFVLGHVLGGTEGRDAALRGSGMAIALQGAWLLGFDWAAWRRVNDYASEI